MLVWVYKESDGLISKGKMKEIKSFKGLSKLIDSIKTDDEKYITVTTVNDFIRININDENILKKAKEIGLDKCLLIIQTS